MGGTDSELACLSLKLKQPANFKSHRYSNEVDLKSVSFANLQTSKTVKELGQDRY